jgi:hypothetical protein
MQDNQKKMLISFSALSYFSIATGAGFLYSWKDINMVILIIRFCYFEIYPENIIAKNRMFVREFGLLKENLILFPEHFTRCRPIR